MSAQQEPINAQPQQINHSYNKQQLIQVSDRGIQPILFDPHQQPQYFEEPMVAPQNQENDPYLQQLKASHQHQHQLKASHQHQLKASHQHQLKASHQHQYQIELPVLIQYPPQLIPQVLTKKTQLRRLQASPQQSPQNFRANPQTMHILFTFYRGLHIHSSSPTTFDQTQQNNSTLNYHKIIQMLKDCYENEDKLKVDTKLQLLRAIKKFSYDQKYITQVEFSKIYKVIVHGMGVKETLLEKLAGNKRQYMSQKQAKVKAEPRKLRIQLNRPPIKVNTEVQIQPIKQRNILDKSHLQSGVERKATLTPLKQTHTSRKLSERKRIYTQSSHKVKKLSHISWQQLLKVKEDNLPSNVVIPAFLLESQDSFLCILYTHKTMYYMSLRP